MNRVLKYILIFIVVLASSCDTDKSVKPRNTDFFFKVYGGIGELDEHGASIIETSDGGLLIVGSTFIADVPQEIVLIKTDMMGNVVWENSYSDEFGAGFTTEGKRILEISSGFVVGGILYADSVQQSIFFKVDQDGVFSGNAADYVKITTNYNGQSYNNWLGDITLGPSGLLVSGTTDRPFDQAGTEVGGLNGFIGLYGEDLTVVNPDLPEIIYFGSDKDEEIAGAFEVKDPAHISPLRDNTHFLAFGSTTSLPDTGPGDQNFFYYGFNDSFLQGPGMIVETTIANSGDQTVSRVKEFGDRYWMIGTSNDNQIFRTGWLYTATGVADWQSSFTGVVSIASLENQTSEQGIALFPIGEEGQMLVAGDAIFSAERKEIVVAEINSLGRTEAGWPRIFGNTSSAYEAADIIKLSDGSVVTLGTADLEPIKKMVVIKTGPNGEMSFD